MLSGKQTDFHATLQVNQVLESDRVIESGVGLYHVIGAQLECMCFTPITVNIIC